MRIAVFNASGADLAQGGTERHVDRMLRLLPPRGVEVLAIAAFPPQDPGSLATRSLHRTHWRDSLARRIQSQVVCLVNGQSGRVSDVLDDFRPDVVNTHNLPGFGTGVWAASGRRGIPVVHAIHDFQLDCRLTTLMTRRNTPCNPVRCGCSLRRRSMLRHAGAVSHLVAGTRFAMGFYDNDFVGAPRTVIPNPVPNTPWAERPPRTSLRSVGYIGGLQPTKGVHHLLDAATDLSRMGIELHIAGSGQLADRAQAMHDAGRITYWGHVTAGAKREFFGACDVGVVPSEWMEVGGPPNALIEWLNSGRPVLATRRGCLSELIDLLPGCLEVAVGPAAIVAAIEEMRTPGVWAASLASVRQSEFHQSEESWMDAYLEVFRAAQASVTQV